MKFKKEQITFFPKLFLVVFVIFITFWVFSDRDRRDKYFPYFSTRCLDYRQKEYSRKLNDRIVDYSSQAKLKGIKPCSDHKDLRKRISEGKLVEVKSGNRYVVDKMTYSYPYVTKQTRMLIDEIARRFQEKTSQKGLKKTRFIITSMTRKTENVKSLLRKNSNASANSPHLYGNAFDITYKRFLLKKWVMTNCDHKFMKEALAEVIWQLRDEKKCWATYEKGQSCFHIVSR